VLGTSCARGCRRSQENPAVVVGMETWSDVLWGSRALSFYIGIKTGLVLGVRVGLSVVEDVVEG